MKYLNVLKRINILALGSYFYYFIFAWDDFVATKEKKGLTIVGVSLFIITFLCGIIVMGQGNKKGIANEILLSELKKLPKIPLIILGVICIAEIIMLLVIVHQMYVIWFIGVLIISFVFVIMEMVVIPNIAKSTMHKLSLPWYVYSIPFVVFVTGELYFGYHLPQEVFDKVGMIVFVLCGVLLASIAWHGYYVIDSEQKTLERNKGILPEFLKSKDIMTFDDIRHYEKKRLYYIVTGDEKVYKISRLYDSSKEIENILDDNGVLRINHNL